ncbi:helix-turn-helix domain-containing protein [Streptomyces sp. NPDC101115]|uniref:helix-turn-helix domain-containing protein n=1 Tax=Streptomyces sp. NPDC101115 TaxID=3366106 RepID=UPI0038160897
MQPDGNEIRRQRETHGYGLRKFAKAVGISHSHLSRIERGLRGSQPEVLVKIAQTLGCGIEDLQRDRTEPNDGAGP